MNTPSRTLCRHLLLCSAALIPFQSASAASLEDRACNLQGREIALRISEELSSDLSATARSRIAAIAEEVCVQYAAAAPADQVPVVSRPAAARPAPQAVAAPAAPEAAETAGSEPAEEEEESGLFNLRIIDPEDRVQRPGLKRP